MKKIIAIFITCVMLASMAAVGADAMVIFHEPFDAMNENAWNYYKALFYIQDGRLEGWSEAVVLESFYPEDFEDIGDGQINGWTNFTAQVEVYPLEAEKDGLNAGGLWYGDYGAVDYGAEERDMYFFMCDFNTGLYYLSFNQEDGTGDDPEVVLGKWQGPEIKWGESVCKMGIRVEPGKIICFVDGVDVISYEKESIGTKNTPVLLWNRNNYIQFDNVVIGDLEELKPVSAQTPVDPPVDNGGNTDGGNTDGGNTDGGNTDNGNADNGNADNGNADNGNADNGNADNGNADNGNADNGNADNGNADNGNADNGNADNGNANNGANTQKPADTNQGSGNNVSTGTQTSDAAVAVIVVMIATLGTALVVKRSAAR